MILNIDKLQRVERAIFEPTTTIDISVAEGAECLLLVCAEQHSEQKIRARLERGARLSVTTVDVGSSGMKRYLVVELDGEGAECDLNGVFVVRGEDKVENRTTVRHNVAHCRSEQNYRGVATDSGRALFGGLIYVASGAGDSVALQENHNVVLSDTAKIESQPQMEIYADDVKCNHGATVGKRDEQAMFYMRQRGISEADAQAMLLESFCFSAIELGGFGEEVRSKVAEVVADALRKF